MINIFKKLCHPSLIPFWGVAVVVIILVIGFIYPDCFDGRGSVIIFVATLALVTVTSFYAYHTRSLAKVSELQTNIIYRQARILAATTALNYETEYGKALIQFPKQASELDPHINIGGINEDDLKKRYICGLLLDAWNIAAMQYESGLMEEKYWERYKMWIEKYKEAGNPVLKKYWEDWHESYSLELQKILNDL
jgi:hypothetical protein